MRLKFNFIIVLCTIVSYGCVAQNAPSNANTIIAKNVSFLKVCSALLDSGYAIEKKDVDLMTVSTEKKEYPKVSIRPGASLTESGQRLFL